MYFDGINPIRVMKYDLDLFLEVLSSSTYPNGIC